MITTNNSIDALNWRYATKQFDPAKKIASEDLQVLLEAVRLAPSSYGLQPYKVFVIEDKEIREKLKSAAYQQPQITDASHLVVFAAKTNISTKYVADYMSSIAKTRKVEIEQVQGFGDYINKTIGDFTPEQFTLWNSKQAYIALGNLIQTAAEMKIDAAPMEGFDAAQFDEILNLKKLGLTTAVIAAVGYRSSEDGSQHLAKVRLEKSELFVHL